MYMYIRQQILKIEGDVSEPDTNILWLSSESSKN